MADINTKTDHGVLLIHGIGNREPKSTLKEQGKNLASHITKIIPGDNSKLVKNEDFYKIKCADSSPYKNIYMREVHWAKDDGYKKEFQGKLSWILIRIPVLLMLFLYDYRDVHEYTIKSSFTRYFRAICRFIFAISTFFVPFTSYRFIQIYCGDLTAIIVCIILCVIIILLILYSKRNLINHIRVATERQDILEKIYSLIDEEIRSFPSTVKRISLIAHSQGGYIAYSYILLHKSIESRKIHRLFGVGSGLIPISILRRINTYKDIIKIWVIFIVFLISFLNLVFILGDIAYAGLNFLIRLFITVIDPTQLVYTLFLDDEGINKLYTAGTLIPLNEVILCIVFIFFIVTAIKAMFKNIDIAIAPLPISVWEEFSSVHDPVGRLTPVFLTNENEEKNKIYPNFYPVGIPGDPISIHKRYFKEYSSVLHYISRYIYFSHKPSCNVLNNIYNHSIRRRKFMLSITFPLSLFTWFTGIYTYTNNGYNDYSSYIGWTYLVAITWVFYVIFYLPSLIYGYRIGRLIILISSFIFLIISVSNTIFNHDISHYIGWYIPTIYVLLLRFFDDQRIYRDYISGKYKEENKLIFSEKNKFKYWLMSIISLAMFLDVGLLLYIDLDGQYMYYVFILAQEAYISYIAWMSVIYGYKWDFTIIIGVILIALLTMFITLEHIYFKPILISIILLYSLSVQRQTDSEVSNVGI